MSLKGFHVLFIVAATLLAWAFGAWCLAQYREAGGAGNLVAAAASAGAGLALAIYGAWFLGKMRRLA